MVLDQQSRRRCGWRESAGTLPFVWITRVARPEPGLSQCLVFCVVSQSGGRGSGCAGPLLRARCILWIFPLPPVRLAMVFEYLSRGGGRRYQPLAALPDGGGCARI